MDPALQAGFYGVLAASGLILGAVIGLLTRPSRRIVAVVTAFGSGTLLAALAFDLTQDALSRGNVWLVGLGFFVGGAMFVVAGALIDGQGGFLRREGTRNTFLRERKREQETLLLEQLAENELMRSLPPEEMRRVVPLVEDRVFKDGEVVFRKGDSGDALYLITDGRAELSDGDQAFTLLGRNSVFGEMALLSGEPRNATVTAKGELHTYRLARKDFLALLPQSRSLSEAVHQLMEKRLRERHAAGHAAPSEIWLKVAAAHLDRTLSVREEADLAKKHAGAMAGLAIFFGALIDGVPESLVIGATLVGGAPKISFLVAVFLQNFPEAMSSASGMTRAGYSSARVLGMWAFLAFLSGAAALVGQVFLGAASPDVVALSEAIAGGAILALLANTMMPEAFEMGGRAAAFGTIAGFLVSLLVSHA